MEYVTLPNGLRCVLIPEKHSFSVSILLLVKTGSKNEYGDSNLYGLAHFLEHMIFKGTTKRPISIEVNKELDSMGGEHNAFTGKHLTGYHIKVPASQYMNAIDILFDMVFNSLLRKKDMKSEQLVVLEEHKKSLDEPNHIHMITSTAVQKHSGLKYPIIGNTKSILNWKHADLLKYKENYYNPSNIVFSICGKFNKNKVLSTIKKLMKNVKLCIPTDLVVPIDGGDSGPVKSLIKYIPDLKIEHSKAKNGITIWNEKKSTEQIHCTVSFLIPGMHNKDRFALNLLSIILGGGFSSRLFTIVREKHGLAYTINSDTDYYEEGGEFTVYAGLDRKRLKKALTIIVKEVLKLSSHLVTKEELSKAKKIVSGEIELSQEDTMEVAEYYGAQLLFKPQSKVISFKKLRDIYTSKKMTRKYLRDVARKYIKKENLVVVLLGKCKGKECVSILNKI